METPGTSAARIIPWLCVVLALLILGVGFRIVLDVGSLVEVSPTGAAGKPATLCSDCMKDGYAAAMPFFTLGVGLLLVLLLLPRLHTFKFSGVELALRDLKEDVTSLKTVNNQLQEQSVGSGVPRAAALAPEVQSRQPTTRSQEYADDPQKGKWGDSAEANGRKLTATVRPTDRPGLYRVTLVVSGTEVRPLRQAVRFHLHPTFRNSTPVIAPVNNQATLHLSNVYGAFTVGAETDDGATRLELDLAELPGITKEFENG